MTFLIALSITFYTSFEALGGRSACFDSVFCADQSIWSHFSLIRAAERFSVKRLPSAFQQMLEDYNQLFVSLWSAKFILGLL